MTVTRYRVSVPSGHTDRIPCTGYYIICVPGKLDTECVPTQIHTIQYIVTLRCSTSTVHNLFITRWEAGFSHGTYKF